MSVGISLEGRVYSTQVYNGIDGTLVVDFDAGDYESGSTWDSSETGETWTINGNASIYQGYWDAKGPFGYMAEAAATNLCLQSEDFSTTWSANRTTVTANAAVAPDGTMTADKLDNSGTTSDRMVMYQSFTSTNATYSQSCYFQAGTIAFAQLGFYDGSSTYFAGFNLLTGAEDFADAGTTTSIEDAGDGWYRCTVHFLYPSTTGRIYVGGYKTTNTPIYAPSVTNADYVYTWAAQAELGSFPTAYIPTTTTSVTRNADVLTYDDAGNIEDAAGTAYVEASSDWSSQSAQRYALSRYGNGYFPRATTTSSSVASYDGTNFSLSPSGTSFYRTPQKTATTWGDALTAYSPAALQPDASPALYDGTIGTGDIGVGSSNGGTNQWSGTIRNVQIYSTELTAAEVQDI